MGWRCRADGGRQDRKQQDFCKKMFEGDWVAQSGPTVHGQGDWQGLEVGAQREQAWLGLRGACTVPRERDR